MHATGILDGAVETLPGSRSCQFIALYQGKLHARPREQQRESLPGQDSATCCWSSALRQCAQLKHQTVCCNPAPTASRVHDTTKNNITAYKRELRYCAICLQRFGDAHTRNIRQIVVTLPQPRHVCTIPRTTTSQLTRSSSVTVLFVFSASAMRTPETSDSLL